ncbi:hypothetical protein HPB49_009015 [Dermacentor silvarum]|uniref:Uncharacterized protein n=1 Tax=Dermacentor silvarum TaxID=543639 RepID=A0ACB8C8L1_DERSI|nr:hypothetical protein HPB49_009015 [Dermacentor silvarum]
MAQLLTRMVKMLFQKSHSGNVDAAAMTALMAPSTTGKGRSSRGDKARASDSDAACPRKRGNNSSSDTESGPSEQEMDGDPTTQDSYGNGHSPKVPPLKIVLPSSGTGNLEGTEPAGGANSKERKVSSSKPALPYVVNAAESLSEGSPSEQAVEEKERRREEERCQRVTRSSHRAALTHEEEVEDAPEPPTLIEEVSQPVTNGFQMYLDIRKQVEKRRQAMLVVHPKPPQGFKDYLLNRGSYVLEGNPSSRLSVPMVAGIDERFSRGFDLGGVGSGSEGAASSVTSSVFSSDSVSASGDFLLKLQSLALLRWQWLLLHHLGLQMPVPLSCPSPLAWHR